MNTFSVCLPVRISEWLTEHGYAPAKLGRRYDRDAWIQDNEVTSKDTSLGVFHGTESTLRWYRSKGRRLVGLIYFGPPYGTPDVWKVYIFGLDAPAALFKRSLEEMAASFSVSIEAELSSTGTPREG